MQQGAEKRVPRAGAGRAAERGGAPCVCPPQVDLDCLSADFRKEQKEYYLHTSQWTDTRPHQMLGSPTCFKRYNLNTVTLAELQVRACMGGG